MGKPCHQHGIEHDTFYNPTRRHGHLGGVIPEQFEADGEINLTMLFEGADGSPGYLVRVERSDVDTLGGRFARLKRAAIEAGVKAGAAKGLAALRDRLESKP